MAHGLLSGLGDFVKVGDWLRKGNRFVKWSFRNIMIPLNIQVDRRYLE